MENSSSESKPVSEGQSNVRTFYIIQIVFIVAFFLATIFTAWTDPSVLPFNLRNRLASEVVPPPTSVSELQVTSTPAARLIGIVVGHWDDETKDPGSVCADGLTEFEVNQVIATEVEKLLVVEGFDVDLLKEFDQRLANYTGLALVSIHADSCDYINDEATGFKVSAALSNTNTQKAARLTQCIRNRYSTITKLPLHNSITADMTSYHAFDEINELTTAAIIEVGFLHNDREILTKQPDIIAKGIADGIICFTNNEDINP